VEIADLVEFKDRYWVDRRMKKTGKVLKIAVIKDLQK
jgi:hypothetical protein